MLAVYDISNKLTFDLLTLKVVFESRVTCMGYLCANCSLPRPLCSRVTPDVHDRQTDVRQKHRLMLERGRIMLNYNYFGPMFYTDQQNRVNSRNDLPPI